MSDIASIWDQPTASADWLMSGTQVASGGDLATAILISLFSDRLAESDDAIPDLTDDARGWWGDVDEPYRVGSRLWLLSRARRTADVLLRAKDYIAQALQWLIDDGAVVKFDIETEFVGEQLRAGVTAYRRDGSTIAQSFSWVWNTLTPA